MGEKEKSSGWKKFDGEGIIVRNSEGFPSIFEEKLFCNKYTIRKGEKRGGETVMKEEIKNKIENLGLLSVRGPKKEGKKKKFSL